MFCNGLRGFTFQHLQEERQLGYLDGLRVNVHAVEVVQEDAFAFGGGQPPAAALRLVQDGVLARRPLLRDVGYVPVAVPVKQALIRSQQERSGAAGGVEDADFRNVLWGDILNFGFWVSDLTNFPTVLFTM